MKYSIILFLIFAHSAFAQNVLKGRVLSLQDKTPLNYVAISIEGKAIVAQSDENGQFEIHYVINPSDVIVFNRIGYITRKIQVKEFIPDLQKDIFLDNNLFTSQTILVRGSIDQ